MSRNGEAHEAFYTTRNHAPEQRNHPLMMGLSQVQKVMAEGTPESQAKFKKHMGKQRSKEGGWAGHMPGPMDPYSKMAGEVARAWESGSNYGEIDPRPIPVSKPPKAFKPRKKPMR